MSAKKIALLLLIVLVVGLFFLLDLDRHVTLENLKENRNRLLALYESRRLLVIGGFVLLYVVQTAFSLPGAAVLSLAGGAVFGVLPGMLAVLAGATAGAVIAFLVSRTLLREWVVHRFGRQLGKIDQGIRENGLSYLLFLRLVPVFPFFLINLAAGLTGMPARTYALGTFLGIIPGTFVYVNAGASLATIDSLSEVASPRVIASFVLLGLFVLIPTIYRKVKEKRGRPKDAAEAGR
jgi:uncharacterized membrane protein YdjX (TVP38/TMEM64 family)